MKEFMRKIRVVVIAAACLCLFLLPVLETQAATRRVVSYTRAYKKYGGIRDGLIFYDFYLDFDIPANAYDILAYTVSSGIEGRVFGYSATEIPSPSNGIRRVSVVAGYRARKCSYRYEPIFWTCDYQGSVAEFGNTVRLRYYVP